MPELRWALFGLGALFIVGLALWEWRRSRRRHAQSAAEVVPTAAAQPARAESWSQRVEPRIDSLLGPKTATSQFSALDDVPVIHPAEPLNVPVAREAAVDLPGALRPASHEVEIDESSASPPAEARGLDDVDADIDLDRDLDADEDETTPSAEAAATSAAAAAPAIRWPPHRADRVLTLRVVNAQGALLSGREVRLALEQAGLVPGPQTIFHRVGADGAVLASAANLVRPGDLDPVAMDEQQLRGLSIFSVLPGALPPVRMLEELVALARAVAWRLGAIVQDDQGQPLEGDRLLRLRQSLPEAAGE